MCTCLDRLQAHRVISPCDPGHRRGAIKRAGRRPPGWDLNLGMTRQALALAQVGVAAPEHQFPGLAAKIATASPPGTDEGTGGVQPPHPAPGNGEPVDKVPGEVQQVHVMRHIAPDNAFVLSPACICATCSPASSRRPRLGISGEISGSYLPAEPGPGPTRLVAACGCGKGLGHSGHRSFRSC